MSMITNSPWTQTGVPWKSESQFWGFVRSALRQAWSKHPVKLSFIKEYRIRVPNPNPDGRNEYVWGMQCCSCGGKFCMPIAKKVRTKIEKATGVPFNYIEINHKTEAGSLKSKDDLGRFASNLLYVTFDDLEPQCKKCHSEITYASKEGVSLEEAVIHKQVIAIMKTKDEKNWLIERGVTPASSAPKRRKQVYEELSK